MAGYNMGSRKVPTPPNIPTPPKPKKTEVDVCREALQKVGLVENRLDPRIDGFVVVYKFLKDKYIKDGEFEA